jgi:hypothetical protein
LTIDVAVSAHPTPSRNTGVLTQAGGAGIVTEKPLLGQFDFVVPCGMGVTVGSDAGAVAGATADGCSFRGIGITKLVGYSRRISVIESMIP